MLEQGLVCVGKRARSEQHSRQQTEASPPTKRRKASPPTETPPAFWDNLSKKSLTKRALRELDRRNNQAFSSASRIPQEQSIASEQGEADYLRTRDPSILKALKTFSRHGGPDLSDLRNFPEPTRITKHTMSASQQPYSATPSTRPTTTTRRTKGTGVYDRDFEQHLIDHHVYPKGYKHPDGSMPAKPDNWDDLHNVVAQPRASLSPSRFSNQDFEKFQEADLDAKIEKQVSELVVPIVEGTIQDARCSSGGIPFNNLDPLTDGTLKPGNPDIYYGARPEQLNREIRKELGGHIIPSTQHDLPLAPNFFLAAKGRGGLLEVAERQACYDGALGARGMASLQSYGQREPNYGKAYTISSIYHGGTLTIYTTHMTRSPSSRPEYHMNQLRSFAMNDTADAFRQGARAYRNLRDWAKEQRDELIRQANGMTVPAEVEIAADEETRANLAESFVTAASDTEACTVSQKSHITTEGSKALGIVEESDEALDTRT